MLYTHIPPGVACLKSNVILNCSQAQRAASHHYADGTPCISCQSDSADCRPQWSPQCDPMRCVSSHRPRGRACVYAAPAQHAAAALITIAFATTWRCYLYCCSNCDRRSYRGAPTCAVAAAADVRLQLRAAACAAARMRSSDSDCCCSGCYALWWTADCCWCDYVAYRQSAQEDSLPPAKMIMIIINDGDYQGCKHILSRTNLNQVLTQI